MLDSEDLFAPDELAEYEFLAGDACPVCGHVDDDHDENGCHHEGCECEGP